jgi:hypothetical protein
VPGSKLEQQRVQCLPLLGVERCEEVVLEALADRAEPCERALPLGGEADDVAAPVVRVSLAFDDALLLELVQEADERAPVVAERVRDRGLRLGQARVEQREDRVVVRVEALLLVHLLRPALGGEAEALEQEETRRD